jgi:hypothetical protein
VRKGISNVVVILSAMLSSTTWKGRDKKEIMKFVLDKVSHRDLDSLFKGVTDVDLGADAAGLRAECEKVLLDSSLKLRLAAEKRLRRAAKRRA